MIYDPFAQTWASIQREVGSLINWSTTVRTVPRFGHLHRRPHRLLALSATRELLIIDLIAQHDSQPDAELACHGHTTRHSIPNSSMWFRNHASIGRLRYLPAQAAGDGDKSPSPVCPRASRSDSLLRIQLHIAVAADGVRGV